MKKCEVHRDLSLHPVINEKNCHYINRPEVESISHIHPLFTLIVTSKDATSALYSTRFGVCANLALTHFT
jgi:hypothetical protein